MKRPVIFCVAVVLGALALLSACPASALSADAAQRDLDAIGAPIQLMPVDPHIAHAINQISPAQVHQIIAKLVSFRNRGTLSSMDKDFLPGTGVTAANWIDSQFQAISAQCGGCLEVHRDTFTQAPGTGPHARISQPTAVTDVYAVLRGTDPNQSARMLLVTGHYDSRNSSNFNTHGPDPGANDDAGGVAVSLECARALSKLHLPATLVFVAIAGEEQGLYGSRHLAAEAKQQNWQLEGVLNNVIFGVMAVDPQGHRSPSVVPWPGR